MLINMRNAMMAGKRLPYDAEVEYLGGGSVDGGIAFSTAHLNGFENNINSFGVGFAPGIAYSVSNKVTLVSHLGDGLYFNHTWRKDDYHKNSYGFKFANAISFGAYYSF